MENSKRPKVQNMNDFVNGTGDSVANTQTVKTPVTSTQTRTNNTAVRSSQSVSRPAASRPANTNTSDAAQSQRRSTHVSTGMRSAARSSSSQERPSSAKMQTVQVGRGTQQARSQQTRPQQARPQQSKSQQARPAQRAAQEQRVADPTPMRKGASGSRKYKDLREEKRNKQAISAKRTRSENRSKKMGKWGKFLIILSAVLLVILVVGSIIFSSFLKSYEQGQPSNIASNIVKEFSSGSSLKSYLNKNKDKIHCLEDFDTLVEGYSASVDGKKISYVYDTTSTADAPKYNITADGTIVGKITMAKDGKGSFGLTKWKVGALDIASFMPGAKSYDILVPEGSKVTVNGTELDDSYITNSGVPAVLQGSVDFIKAAPTFTTYTVGGFTKVPDVTAVDSSGNALKLSETESTFMAGQETSQAFIDDVKPLVERGLENWATYFIHMSDNLEPYILKDSLWHKYIFGAEDFDPIFTWLYNFEQIGGYEFTEFEVSNFVKYADDCFTCDVKYHLDITFTEPGMSDDNQGIDATWVWVADGDSWSISDVIYH